MNPYRLGPFTVRVHDITGKDWEEVGTRAMDAAREAFPQKTRLQTSSSMGGPWRNPPASLESDDLYWEANLSVGAYDSDEAFGCVPLICRETLCERLVVINDVTGNSPDEIARRALEDARVREVFREDEKLQVDFFLDLETRIPDHLTSTDRYYTSSVWVGPVD